MKSFTPKMLEEFDRITLRLSSRDQLTRIDARIIELPEFIAKHGRAVCDAMFEHLQARDERRKLQRYSEAGRVKGKL